MDGARGTQRVFKTAWFAKAARKALIGDEELCSAMREVMRGKKRLGKNLYRSILVARGGHYWVYEYLFAKQDRANIDAGDLARLRKLGKAYEALGEREVDDLIRNKKWTEICDGLQT